MGHGAARELESSSRPVRKLDPELARRLEEALEAFDQVSAEFKSSRDDERLSQMSKRWGRASKDVMEHLRNVGKVLIQGHQLALDFGSDGGGIQTRPWVEEVSAMSWDKLYFRLEEDARVTAFTGEKVLAQVAHYDDVTYEWLERCTVAWAIYSIQTHQGKRLTG